MRSRSWLVGGLALMFGGSAAVGVHAVRAKPGEQKTDTVDVVVAAADVLRGTTVDANMLKTAKWPKDMVPPGAVTSVADAVARTALFPLTKDELLLNTKLAGLNAGRGMASLIPKGMRAIAIQTLNVSSGVAGFILPGNRVDVLLTVSVAGTDDLAGGGTTTTLLQNVEILAIDSRIDAPADNRVDPKELRSVTLAVSPDDAAKLNLGQNKGTLHLSLRNPEDDLTAETHPATLAELRYTQKPANPESDSVPAPIAAAPAVELKPVVAIAAVAPPAPTRIRTMRGRHNGEVRVLPYYVNSVE